MNDQLDSLIKKVDWKGVLDYLAPLSSVERYDTFKYLNEIDINRNFLGQDGWNLKGKTRDDFFDHRKRVSSCLDIAMLACTRNLEEVKKVTDDFKLPKGTQIGRCLAAPHLGHAPIVSFFSKYPPDYLNTAIRERAKERFAQIDFKILWKLYENDWVSFDEEFFVRSLFIVHMFGRSTVVDAEFLMDHPKAFENVFLQFHKYELPVLDISKWQGRYAFQCAKVNTYWTEVMELFLEKGVEIPRTLVKHLLESLLNNWKKPHLNWHISLILLLEPTKAEYLKYQNLLFALLNSDNLRTLNFTVDVIRAIHEEKDFDHESFVASAPTLFIREKVDKTLAKLLSILEFSLDKHPTLQKESPQQFSMGLVQVNTQTQAKFAALLAKYTPKTDIAAHVEPYLPVLKIKALEILGVERQEEEAMETLGENEAFRPVQLPQNWDDLLFHIGTCISTKSACDIDLFFEGLIQLQDAIPEDYQKQLKPYRRQLDKRTWELEVMLYFREFVHNWCEGNKTFIENVSLRQNHISFLRNKSKLAFAKLSTEDKTPFLSTPTHLPFYVHPDILIDRLVQYEQSGKQVDLEDLIVAVNRIAKVPPSGSTLKKAKALKGKYANAIQFVLGISETVQLNKRIFSSNGLLPLWSQVCRTRHPEKKHTAFLKSKASSIPTVVEPFYQDFRIEVETSDAWTWYRLKIDGNWNNMRWYYDEKDKPKSYPALYYYAAPHGLASRVDILYQISLLPHYVDAWLCRYIPDTSSGNEVAEFEQCQYPLQALLEYRLKVYHCGWLYIAQCLIFEKRISRELAAEYILFSLKADCIDRELLAEGLATMITEKYAPVKRLTEYIERPGHSKAIKKLQHTILGQCIRQAEQGRLPNSFKKVMVLYEELGKELNIKEGSEIIDKMKSLKK